MKHFLILFILLAISVKTYSQCSVSIETIQLPSCQYNDEGILSAVNLTGSAPFSIHWSVNSDTSLVIDSLSSGNYSVTLTDSTGCIATAYIFLSQEMNIAISTIPISCSSCCDGSATVIPITGAPPFQYIWSPGFNTTPSISGLCSGTYTCCITDSMGCISCVSFEMPGDTIKKRISGFLYVDADSNSIFNSSDFPFRRAGSVMLLPDSITTYANETGQYWFAVDSGNYILKIDTIGSAEDSLYSLSSALDEYPAIVGQSSLNGFDFGFKCLHPQHKLKATLVMQQPRCVDLRSKVLLCISNSGTYVERVEIKMIHSSNLIYINSNINPIQISGDTILFEILNLNPKSEINIIVNFYSPTTGTLVNVSTITEALDSLNNINYSVSNSKTQIVLCSLDPNEKSISIDGILIPDTIPYNNNLQYTIFFQNTGTDTALNVVILDTLDENLDPNSLQLISSSDMVSLHLDRVTNQLEFTFNNIQLPDSNVDEQHSHGFVTYSITPKSNLTPPFNIYNTAHIYFDLNPAVTTNTTHTTLISSTSNVESLLLQGDCAVTMVPNPCNQNCSLILNSSNNFSEISILDLLGVPIATFKNFNENIISIPREIFPSSGIYVIRAFDKNHRSACTSKMIIY
jgi:uncharacterized repeat protein (TIGR01451 family)